MANWTTINSEKINRVGYNKDKESLHVDFSDSETDTVFLKVPQVVYNTFIEVKSPDKFYSQLVEGYFDVASHLGIISFVGHQQKQKFLVVK